MLRELHIVNGDFSLIHDISPELVKKKCCKRSYLRGAFLAGGSVNNPETSSYHLEIFSLYEEHNRALCELMNSHFFFKCENVGTEKGVYYVFKRGGKNRRVFEHHRRPSSAAPL
ncbi:putative cytosolic protein [Geobacillus sp. WSUCF1]|nr:DNA-binding protein WhiA [Geobacillus sp. WSUCF1]EPR26933.1 putative cytosolic protein [Geobacillus sp. WSUCF1]